MRFPDLSSIYGLVLSLSLLAFPGISQRVEAKTLVVPVEEIFANLTDVTLIEVLAYSDQDTTMIYLNLKTGDTLAMDNWTYHFFSKSYPSLDTLTHSWENTWPLVGERIVMLRYNYGIERFLFARQWAGEYRFWNPMSMPFANMVYLLPEQGPYRASPWCEQYEYPSNDICDDGFTLATRMFRSSVASWKVPFALEKEQ